MLPTNELEILCTAKKAPLYQIYRITGFNYTLPGLSIVVSERDGETDEEIPFTYNPTERIKHYNLQYYRYVQYVRIKASSASYGMVLDEVEVYAFSEYFLFIIYSKSFVVFPSTQILVTYVTLLFVTAGFQHLL